ncbi:MAG: hypothetical protein JO369_01515 [Paucibacter sp.]|nr:hypothetical protein [Roseateles sp.]
MNLQQARDWSDLVLKVCSIVAILVAGAWAFFQFQVAGTTAENIQLTVSAEVLPYGEGTRLLIVHAKPKNIGKVPVEITKGGFPAIVRTLPSTVKSGPVVLANQPESFKVDVLKRFPDGYRLEPGVEYDELFPVVVPIGPYSAEASLDLDAETEVDHAVVVSVR